MAATVVGKTLTNVDVILGGRVVRLNLTDANGRTAALELSIDCVNQLIMTLPHIVNLALRSRYGDDSVRLVFSLDRWRLEQAAGDERMILTFATDDGFEVSFVAATAEIERMGRVATAADAAKPFRRH